MTDLEEYEDTLSFYRQTLAELPQEEQDHVNLVLKSMNDLIAKTGRQGVIAAGLFCFELMVKHLRKA